MTPLHVLKFGGTSLASAERIERVGQIVTRANQDARVVVVVSAMGGVTSDLIDASVLAAQGDEAYLAVLDRVVALHDEPLASLVAEQERERVLAAYQTWAEELEDRLHGISLVGECTVRTLDAVLAFGELVSSTLLTAMLRKSGMDAEACDARALIVTDDAFGSARVDRETTAERVRVHFAATDAIQVVTGFIASSPGGETTTLGRGGSDYTAALLAADLSADRLEIWTDVDGVMSADPRLVPQAFPLAKLSYEELMELSHFGAKVVYPPSVHPARERRIPLVIRNTFNVEFDGTHVGEDAAAATAGPVRGISSINDVALLRLEGDGMVGVPGVVARLFQALARDEVNVILISQASSEHSICFAVAPASVARVLRSVEDEFSLERTVGLVEHLIVEEDLSIIAAVGEAMRDTLGIAGRLFSVLGQCGVNVHAIAQGSSELNISLVVAKSDEVRALQALHDAFFQPRASTAQVFLAGVGNVGAALLTQIEEMAHKGDEGGGTVLRLVGVASSRRSLLDGSGVSIAEWQQHLEASDRAPDAVIEQALEPTRGAKIFVDCTASEEISGRYEDLLASGTAVVAANKWAFSGSMDRYRALTSPAAGSARAYFETTVGAGLPVLRTISDLVATGDEIVSVEGVFSGTLGFVIGEVMAGRSFSEALAEARAGGYTEPDPREDLSGRDAVRKLLIVARVAGMVIEPADVRVESLLPGDGWQNSGIDSFMSRTPEVDETFAQRRTDAIEQGRHLCFLGSVSREGATVGLTAVAREHPCYGISGTDNVIIIRTVRYPTPVVVRGAGAGPEVTAAGVLADILAAVRESTNQVEW